MEERVALLQMIVFQPAVHCVRGSRDPVHMKGCTCGVADVLRGCADSY